MSDVACLVCCARVDKRDADAHLAWHEGLTEALVALARPAADPGARTPTPRD